MSLLRVFQACQREGKALLSINIFNFETLFALKNVAHNRRIPVIAQFSKGIFSFYPPSVIASWKNVCQSDRLFVHLDHCDDIQLIIDCAAAGFDAVMFDGSHYAIDENINASRGAAKGAKEANPQVLFEAEIGEVGGVEDAWGAEDTVRGVLRSSDVDRFYEEVQPELFAIGFGNKHGHYRGNEVFDIDLIRHFHAMHPNVFQVLHGGSGMDLNLVAEVVSHGTRKINISTDLKVFWIELQKKLADENAAPVNSLGKTLLALEAFFDRLFDKYAAVLPI